MESKALNTESINYPELICSLIEEIRLSSKLLANLPEYIHIKDSIMVNSTKYYGDVKPYAMRNGKNGYPHFLLCLDGNWVWKSAKYFEVRGW